MYKIEELLIEVKKKVVIDIFRHQLMNLIGFANQEQI
jgi:hypothetical protein